MKLRQLLEVDVAFWIEYIVRSLVPMIAFLATCGLYVLDYGREARKAFNHWHINWITSETTEPQTYDISLFRR